jgi:RNA polymerase subunit RPABC4/transcription elongation factor Spt4
MTETADAKKSLMGSLVGDFKALTPKQWFSIVAAFAVCMVLILTGLYVGMCLGFFLIAVILYMIPHIAGVSSPGVKAVIGVTFIVVMLLIGTFAYSGNAVDDRQVFDENVDPSVTSMELVDDALIITTPNQNLDLWIVCAPVSKITYGSVSDFSRGDLVKEKMPYIDGAYVYHVDLKDEKFYYIESGIAKDEDATSFTYYILYKVNTGLTNETGLNFAGAGYLMMLVGLIFFVMLIFSELMRRSARKSREKMERDGRLYPKGYSKCKNCGTMVLPGEINCRKCGAPIEVPEDVKVLHKKDFFECSECGTEVPMDAKMCPKCGAVFDEADVAEIKHVDGTVDVSSDTFECSECGKTVPANAKRCPYCGAEFDEDDE